MRALPRLSDTDFRVRRTVERLIATFRAFRRSPVRRTVERLIATFRAYPGWTALMVVTATLSCVAAGKSVLPGDVAVTRTIQSWSIPGGDLLATTVNIIGGTLGACLVAMSFAYYCARNGHGAAALVILGALAMRFGNAFIKAPLDSPRPSANLVYVAQPPEGLGFPSAHVMGVVLLYGALLMLAPDLVRCRTRRGLVQAGSILMLLTIGYGRISAGAHWPSDVLGAYLYGVLGLAGLLALYRRCQDGRLPDPSPAVHRAVGGISSGMLLFKRFLLPMPPRRPITQVAEARAGETRRRER